MKTDDAVRQADGIQSIAEAGAGDTREFRIFGPP